jgi:uncharacterized protein (TIGR03083 family)
MRYLQPVLAADLFPGERAALLEVLTSLSDEQWASPTVCEGWSVHDVMLHVLGGDIGIISSRRDGYREPATAGLDLSRWDVLVAFINERNDAWVQATRRISPRLLCEFLRLTGEALASHFAQLDPFAPGAVVSWASPEPAPTWLDTAREYTERWLHQQHVRDAVGQPGLTEPRWLAPVLATFAYALPRALQPVEAPEGATVQLVMRGEAGGVWNAVRAGGAWELTDEAAAAPDARVTLDQEVAWRLFTRGLSRESAAAQVQQEGEARLAERVLDMVSIIA